MAELTIESILGTFREDQESTVRKTAEQLLTCTQIVTSLRCFRLLEIEFYYFSDRHPDPFTHCGPAQQCFGNWYFHRTGKGLRGGSFKGVDLSFGSEKRWGGWLIRTLQDEEGRVTNGCSLCVDRLIEGTQSESLRALNDAVVDRKIWDKESLIRLEVGPDLQQRVLETARVGLSLKKQENLQNRAERYVVRRYRFHVMSNGIKKGRLYTALAMIADGVPVPQIVKETGSPPQAIRRYMADFELGKELEFNSFIGSQLSSEAICKLHGCLA